MTTPTVTETRRAGQTNEPVELARYTVTAGERVIHGQRVLGVVRLVDDPVSGDGRHYVIERELTTMAELDAIVADYLEQARLWDVIPAIGSCPLLAERREAAAMIDRHHPDPAERDELTEQDLAIATLVGRYVERREAGQPPCAHDLLAIAAEFGDTAVDVLRTVLACYEAMRASDDLTT